MAIIKATTEQIKSTIGAEFLTFTDSMKTPIPRHLTSVPELFRYTHTTDEMRRAAASNIDRKIGGVGPRDDIRVSEQPSVENAPKAKFEAYKGKKRKPGTGYVKQLSPNCWQGRYTPTINGKRTSYHPNKSIRGQYGQISRENG